MQFVKDVLAKPKRYSEAIVLACKRHKADLKRKDIYFDDAAATKAVKLIKLMKHTKGEYAGVPFQLMPFQEFIVRLIFGWKVKDTGKRRFRRVYVEIARKNGKTELAAAIATALAFFDNEQGAEVYFAATKRDQAKIGFDAAKSMVTWLQKDSAKVKSALKIYRNTIVKGGAMPSKIEAVSSDYDTLDGVSPSAAIVDEYHAHPNDKLLKVIETGMGSRLNPLLFIITTAGFNKEGPCFQLRKVGFEVLRGMKQDDAFLPIIFSLDEDDDWNDPKTWIKSNPNLGLTPYQDYMDAMYRAAKNEGASAEIEFRTKNLNQWTNVATVWIKDEDWKACNQHFDPEELAGRQCFGGLDLARTRDLCSMCLFFPALEEGQKHIVLWRHWCPEDNAIERTEKEGVQYLQWAADGWLTLTPGNVTDYNWIKEAFRADAQRYDIHSTAFDRYNASQLVIDLQDEGFILDPFGQGYVSMSAPTKEIERLVLTREFTHLDNPMLRWMNSNVQIITDPAGNIKMDKGRSREKIDGMVAFAMAVGQWLKNKSADSAYNRESDILML